MGKELASPLVQAAADALGRKGMSGYLLLCLFGFDSPVLVQAPHSPPEHHLSLLHYVVYTEVPQ